MYENASKGAARREIFADSKFLYSLIEKRSGVGENDRQDVMNNFFLYGFCSLDGFHQPDLFSIR